MLTGTDYTEEIGIQMGGGGVAFYVKENVVATLN